MRQRRSSNGRGAGLLERVFVAGALLGVLAVPPSFGAGLQNSAWPMFHKDAAHTGRSTNPIPLTAAIVWASALTDSADYSSPAIDAAGNVYIGDLGRRLNSFGPAGNLRWSFVATGNFRRSSPAIADDGTVYIGGADSKLYAVNANGTQKWTFTAGGGIRTAPAVGGDGTVYFGADNGRLYAVRANGTLNWSFATGDSVRSSPAIVGDSLVVFGSNDGSIYALRTNGTLAWEGITGAAVKASPAVGQSGTLICPSQDGFLYAIRPNGTLLWAIFTGQTLRSTPATGPTGKIYLGVDDEIQCYRDDGSLSWNFVTGGRIFSSPAVHVDPGTQAETAICGSDDGFLYAVRGGVLLWKVNLGTAVHSSPAIGADGRIYVGGNDGFLCAIGNSSTSVDDPPLFADALAVGPSPLVPGETLRLAWRNEPGGSEGTVRIFTPAGRRVIDLDVLGESTWDARDASGNAVPAGIYLYQWSRGTARGEGRITILR